MEVRKTAEQDAGCAEGEVYLFPVSLWAFPPCSRGWLGAGRGAEESMTLRALTDPKASSLPGP